MPETNLIVDGHVHIYDCYDLDKFFDAAIENLDNMYTSTYPGNNNYQRILLLAEGKDNDYFSQFKRNGILGQQSEYKFENTQEDSSLILIKNDEPVCNIIAGRQIVTSEKLEVLSIASGMKIKDGLPIKDVIERLLDKRDITILAWGVGKWLFKRGEIISDIIKKCHSPYLFIGDNSARPSFWQVPELYHLAEKHNISILRGSDPLPFSEETCRVGTFGFVVEGDFIVNKPVEALQNILISNKSNITLFGYQDKTLSFLKRQTKMFFKKYTVVSG